jgi:hypothetical protein
MGCCGNGIGIIGSASAALGAAAVPLLGRQTLGLLTTILKQVITHIINQEGRANGASVLDAYE